MTSKVQVLKKFGVQCGLDELNLQINIYAGKNKLVNVERLKMSDYNEFAIYFIALL